jgi:hypothetical protein
MVEIALDPHTYEIDIHAALVSSLQHRVETLPLAPLTGTPAEVARAAAIREHARAEMRSLFPALPYVLVKDRARMEVLVASCAACLARPTAWWLLHRGLDGPALLAVAALTREEG